MESTMITHADIVQQKIDEQLMAHGYSTVKNGETVPDENAMKRKVFEIVEKHVVTDKGEKSKNSITNGELYAAAFPNGPGTDPTSNLDNLDFEDAEVRERLVRKVWTLTNGGLSGYIQKRLGENGGTLVLCRGQVMRGLDPVPGCFVTDNAALIMSDSLQPQIESLVKKADNLRKHVDMVSVRHPELEGRISQALGLGVQRTIAALPSATSNGNGNGKSEQKSTPKADK